jgi:hypothetical protein
VKKTGCRLELDQPMRSPEGAELVCNSVSYQTRLAIRLSAGTTKLILDMTGDRSTRFSKMKWPLRVRLRLEGTESICSLEITP